MPPRLARNFRARLDQAGRKAKDHVSGMNQAAAEDAPASPLATATGMDIANRHSFCWRNGAVAFRIVSQGHGNAGIGDEEASRARMRTRVL
jgi:hypothetical protein